MNDLISRDELLKAMNTWDKFGCDCHRGLVRIDSTNNEEYVPFVYYEDMVKCVNDMPTAYSVDKVVDKLEIELEKGNIAIDLGEFRLFEIVKHGGVDDDVCEWKMTDTKKLMTYAASCGNEDLYDNSYKYCPYCGKKIKVVVE